MSALWGETLAPDVSEAEPMRRYLESRSIRMAAWPSSLRFHPSLAYWDGGEVRGRFPAMVAMVAGPEGDMVSLHRTYLSEDGRKADVEQPRKLMSPPVRGQTNGAAIRLFEADGTLAVAEGIETSLSIHVATGLPVWATVTAGGMERLVVPASVRSVVICGDHDVSGTGQAAANKLARRLVLNQQSARVVLPPRVGSDWNDYLREEAGNG